MPDSSSLLSGFNVKPQGETTASRTGKQSPQRLPRQVSSVPEPNGRATAGSCAECRTVCTGASAEPAVHFSLNHLLSAVASSSQCSGTIPIKRRPERLPSRGSAAHSEGARDGHVRRFWLKEPSPFFLARVVVYVAGIKSADKAWAHGDCLSFHSYAPERQPIRRCPRASLQPQQRCWILSII